jgi:EAL domain-containing protein (putative c-di-GMP-specific phosphodiesterase class I)
MVKSMNEIAHAMGKKTIAEFVANERILAVLEGIGVDYAQGFHTGEPELAGYPGLAALPIPCFAGAGAGFAGEGRWQ